MFFAVLFAILTFLMESTLFFILAVVFLIANGHIFLAILFAIFAWRYSPFR